MLQCIYLIIGVFCVIVSEVYAADNAAAAIRYLLLQGDQRIQKSNLLYQGAFALPQETYGGSRYGYGGRGITPYTVPETGQRTLFMEGHAWYQGYVGQVAIPDSFSKSDNWAELPKATVLQEFNFVPDNGWTSLGTTGYEAIFGLLVHNGRLIVGATSWYDAGCQQTASHGVSGLDLSKTDDFQGFYSVDAAANPRSIGGYMTPIPKKWQERFGGTVLTGNAALSIISCISSGPAATVIEPDDFGSTEAVSGTTVVYYPLRHYLVSGGVTEENSFTYGSGVVGVAFPEGSRSVLFFGRQSMADGYCYGPGTDDPELHKVPTEGGTYCYDLCDHSKGGHGYPYYHYVWAYDANDLLKVRAGDLEPWEVAPYAAWKLDEMDDSGCASIRGAAYDPDTRQLYITQGFSEHGRVDVYTITKP